MSHGPAVLGAERFPFTFDKEKSQPEPVTGAHTGRLARAQQRKIHRAAVASPHLPAGHGAQGKQPTSGPAGRPGSAPPRRQRSGSVPSTPWTYQPLRGQAARYCREGLAAMAITMFDQWPFSLACGHTVVLGRLDRAETWTCETCGKVTDLRVEPYRKELEIGRASCRGGDERGVVSVV